MGKSNKLSDSRRQQREQAKQNAKNKAQAQQTVKNNKSYTGNKVVQTVTPQKNTSKTTSTNRTSSTNSRSTGTTTQRTTSTNRVGNTNRVSSTGGKNTVTNSNVKQADKVTSARPYQQTVKGLGNTVGITKDDSEQKKAAQQKAIQTANANRLRQAKENLQAQRRQPAIDTLNANSVRWHNTTDEAEKNRLHAANNRIRSLYGMTYDDKTGRTYLPKAGQNVNISHPVELYSGAQQPQTVFDTQEEKDKRYNEIQAEINRMKNAYSGLNNFQFGMSDNKKADRAAKQQLIKTLEKERNAVTGGTTRKVQAAKAIGNEIVGAPVALAETAQQQSANVEESRKNPEYVKLEQQEEQLELTLAGIPSTDADGKMSSEYMQVYNQLQDVKKQKDQLTVKTAVDPNKWGQQRLAKAAEQKANATTGMTEGQKFVADTAISVAGNAPQMATAFIPVVGPAAATAWTGINAAGQRAYELNQQGVAPNEALGRGIVSGVIEAATEKSPMESLANIATKGGKNLVSNIAKQALSEAGEEALSYAANYAADVAANDPNANFSLSEMGQNALGGAAGGAMFAGIGTGVHALRNGVNYLPTARNRNGAAQNQTAPVDTQAETQYTNTNGGVANGINGQQNGNGDFSAGLQRRPDGTAFDSAVPNRGSNDGRANSGLSDGVLLTSEKTRQIMDERGLPNLGLKESTGDNASFSYALEQAKANNPHGAFVDSQSAEDLNTSGTRTFLSSDGMAGAAVRPDGDIVGVFKNSQNRTRQAVKDLLITALSNGGTKLDCYGNTLGKMYAQMGFVPVARMDFNPEYATDWKPEFGTPDVIFWMHNGDSPELVASKSGTYSDYSNDYIKTLPTFTDYDAAGRYRDMLLAQQQAAQARNANSQGGIGATLTDSQPNVLYASQNGQVSSQLPTGYLPEGRSTKTKIGARSETRTIPYQNDANNGLYSGEMEMAKLLVDSSNKTGVPIKTYVNEIVTPTMNEVNSTIADVKQYVRDYMKTKAAQRGTKKGSNLVHNEDGTTTRIRNNEAWYSEAYKRLGHTPRVKEYDSIAKNIVYGELNNGGGDWVSPQLAQEWGIAQQVQAAYNVIGDDAISAEITSDGLRVTNGTPARTEDIRATNAGRNYVSPAEINNTAQPLNLDGGQSVQQGNVQTNPTLRDISPKATKPRTLNTVIAENHNTIAKGGVVANISGTEIGGGKTVDAVTDFFNKIGNKVTRPGFGDVDLTKSGVRDSISHGIGANKKAAFAAVPSVIESGAIIDNQQNWKGRRYDTVTFGGQITINGTPYDMGVIVKKYDAANRNSKYYLHEVMLTNAESDAVTFKTGTNMGYPSDTASLSTDSIPQGAQNVNTRNPNDISPKLVRAENPNSGTAGTFGQNTVGAAQSAYTPEQKVSKVSSNTFTNSTIFNEAEKQSAKIFDQDGDALYDVVTEKQSLDNARQRLDTDYNGEVRDLPNKPNFSGEDNDTAMGILSRKLEEARQSGDYSEVNKWAKLIKEKGTEGGQLVQSFAKYSRTPEGVIVQGQREIDAAVKLLEKTNPKQLAKWQKQGYFQWTDADAQRSADYMQQAVDAGLDTQEGRTLEAKAMEVIAEKMPVTTKKKIISLLMDNILGNCRTLLTRNAGGNAMFSAPEAIRENFVAAPIDKITSLFTGARTTYASPLAKSKAWAGGAKKGVSEMVSDIQNGVHTARSGETTSWQAQQKTFRDKGLGKIGNAYDSFVGSMLEAGDRPFYEAAFAAKMTDLEKARSQGKLTKDFQGKDFDTYAPQVARQAALEAVFQNNGTVAQAFSNIATGLGKLSKGTLGTASLQQSALPFTKTPGNLVERAIEYSPFGILKNGKQTIHESRTGTFNQQRFVTETSRNIVGSAIFALAGSMVASGMLRGALPDDKDEAEALKNAGEQEYSIRIGDKNYSYSWIPVVGPALAGSADFYQTMNEMDGNRAAAVWAAAEGYLNSAIFEQSSLSSLPDMFGGSYSTPIEGIGKTFASLPSQMVPSLVRQIATATDPYERQTYVKGDTVKSQINSLKSSIPGLRQTLPVKVDEQGNEKKSSQGRGLGSRLAENMILPYKVTQQQGNDVRDELMRLKKSTGETTQFQNKITYAVEHDGKKKNLTAAQSMQYQKAYGTTSTAAIRQLMNSGVYDTLSDKEKVDVITEINSYAKTLADSKFVNVELDTAQQKIKEATEKGIGVGDYIAFNKGVQKIEENNTGTEDSSTKNIRETVDLLENGAYKNMTDTQKEYLFTSTGRALKDNRYHVSDVEKSAESNDYYKNLSGKDQMYFRSLANEYEDAVKNNKTLDGWMAKAKLADEHGIVSPYQFVAFQHALLYADADENGSYKQTEVTNAVNSLSGLTQAQKAYLWQSQDIKWKKNPFGSVPTVYTPDKEETGNSPAAKIDKRVGGMMGSGK